MRRLTNGLKHAILMVLLVSICVLVTVTFLQVFCRFIMKVPVSWSEEVARICFVWLILMGAALGVKEQSHLSLEIMTSMIPEKKRRGMRLMIHGAVILVSLVILVSGYSYVMRSVGKTAVTMPIPANCVYIAAPISAILMILFSVEHVVEEIKNGKEE